MILKLGPDQAQYFTVERVPQGIENIYQRGKYRVRLFGDSVGFAEVGNGLSVVDPQPFFNWLDEFDVPYATVNDLLADIQAKCYTSGGQGFVTEAPKDGEAYVRKDGAWTLQLPEGDYTNTSGAPFSTSSTTPQLVFTHTFNAEPEWTVRSDIVWLFEIDSEKEVAEFDIRVNGLSQFISTEESSGITEVNIITIPITLGVTEATIPLLSGANTVELYARKLSGGALLTIPSSGAITERKK